MEKPNPFIQASERKCYNQVTHETVINAAIQSP